MTTNEIKPNDGPTSTQDVPGGDCGASACSAFDFILCTDGVNLRISLFDKNTHANIFEQDIPFEETAAQCLRGAEPDELAKWAMVFRRLLEEC